MNQITPARRVPAAFAALRPEDNTISDGIGGGFATIGIRSSKWYLNRGGEEIYLQTLALDCIILDAPNHKSRTFYPQWEEGSRKPPACASADGLVPDPGVPNPQARLCADCPQSERKAGADGKLRSACRENKRVAILVCPSTFVNPDGTTLDEPVMLRVPAGSLSDMDKYNKMLSGIGYIHPCMVITRITFDPKASYPKFMFTMAEAIEKMKEGSEETAAYVMEMRGDPLVKRITGDDMGVRRLPPPDNVVQLNAPNQPAQQQVVQAQPQVQVIPPQPEATAARAPAPLFGAKRAAANGNPLADQGTVLHRAPATLQGTVQQPVQQAVQQPAIGQAASDVGEGESAGAEVDAVIQAAMTT